MAPADAEHGFAFIAFDCPVYPLAVFVTNVGVYNQSQGDTGAYASVGVQYNVTPQVGVVAEYERYGKEKDFGAKPDVWTVGARYSF